ncbi:MAG TPA: FkbM family methyltransferase [Gemmatimonadales bacterium]|nr:FkbM family methyltransferase [Gemmatimonadales bacterium]
MTALSPAGLVDQDAPAERASFTMHGREFTVTYPAGTFMREIVRAVLEGREYPVLQLPDGPPSIIVDIGANIGATAVYFRATYPSARILCYEPSPENFVWLAANTRNLPGVEAIQCGLLDREAELPLYSGESQCAQHSIIPNSGTSSRYEQVTVRRASEEMRVRGVTEISLLKVDTEGCEVPILRDLLPAIRRIDAIAVEYHSEEDRRAIDALLAERFLLLHAAAQGLHQGRMTYLSRDVVRRHPGLEALRISPLGTEGGTPDPMESVTLRFESGGEPRAVDLLLDRTSYSQRIMLASLEAGQFYEPEVSYFLTNVLQPGDTVVDVGAHIGYFSVLAGRIVGPEGKVFAFEPEPGNYRRLRDHLAQNGLSQVQSFNVAVGSAPGTAEMYFNSDNDGGHAFWDVAEHQLCERTREEGKRISAEVVALDHVLAGLLPGQGPKLIKIDAEGMEYEILKGALRTILGHEVPFVICEINRFALERMGSSEMQLRGFMRLIGYQVSLMKQDGTGLQPLGDDETYQSENVFNLLFHR